MRRIAASVLASACAMGLVLGIAAPSHAVHPAPPRLIEVNAIIVKYSPGVKQVTSRGRPTCAGYVRAVQTSVLRPGAALGEDTYTIVLSRPQPLRTANKIAAQMSSCPKVEYAEPDLLVQIAR